MAPCGTATTMLFTGVLLLLALFSYGAEGQFNFGFTEEPFDLNGGGGGGDAWLAQAMEEGGMRYQEEMMRRNFRMKMPNFCPFGQIFCLQAGRCVEHYNPEVTQSGPEPSAVRGQCSAMETYLDGRDPVDHTPHVPSPTFCIPPAVYCFAAKRCVTKDASTNMEVCRREDTLKLDRAFNFDMEMCLDMMDRWIPCDVLMNEIYCPPDMILCHGMCFPAGETCKVPVPVVVTFDGDFRALLSNYGGELESMKHEFEFMFDQKCDFRCKMKIDSIRAGSIIVSGSMTNMSDSDVKSMLEKESTMTLLDGTSLSVQSFDVGNASDVTTVAPMTRPARDSLRDIITTEGDVMTTEVMFTESPEQRRTRAPRDDVTRERTRSPGGREPGLGGKTTETPPADTSLPPPPPVVNVYVRPEMGLLLQHFLRNRVSPLRRKRSLKHPRRKTPRRFPLEAHSLDKRDALWNTDELKRDQRDVAHVRAKRALFDDTSNDDAVSEFEGTSYKIKVEVLDDPPVQVEKFDATTNAWVSHDVTQLHEATEPLRLRVIPQRSAGTVHVYRVNARLMDGRVKVKEARLRWVAMPSAVDVFQTIKDNLDTQFTITEDEAYHWANPLQRADLLATAARSMRDIPEVMDQLQTYRVLIVPGDDNNDDGQAKVVMRSRMPVHTEPAILSMLTPHLSIVPTRNYHGTVSFTIQPLVWHRTECNPEIEGLTPRVIADKPDCLTGDPINLAVTVTSVNDAPVMFANRMGHPINVTYDSAARQDGIPVADLAGHFCKDPDGDSVGIYVVSTRARPEYGTWEFQAAGSTRWTALDVGTEDIRDALMSFDKFRKVYAECRVSPRKCAAFSRALAQVPALPDTITVQRLAPDDSIRFNLASEDVWWGKRESHNISLAWGCWDQTADPGARGSISSLYCINATLYSMVHNLVGDKIKPCDDRGNMTDMSEMLHVERLLRQQCDGESLLLNDDTRMVEDGCGVCGGNNQSCADCFGTPNGGGVPDACGECSVPAPGATVDTTAVCSEDCSSDNCALTPSSVCRQEEFVCPAGDTDHCVSNEVSTSDLMNCRDCDDQIGGNKQIDHCGVCSTPAEIARSTTTVCATIRPKLFFVGPRGKTTLSLNYGSYSPTATVQMFVKNPDGSHGNEITLTQIELSEGATMREFEVENSDLRPWMNLQVTIESTTLDLKTYGHMDVQSISPTAVQNGRNNPPPVFTITGQNLDRCGRLRQLYIECGTLGLDICNDPVLRGYAALDFSEDNTGAITFSIAGIEAVQGPTEAIVNFFCKRPSPGAEVQGASSLTFVITSPPPRGRAKFTRTLEGIAVVFNAPVKMRTTTAGGDAVTQPTETICSDTLAVSTVSELGVGATCLVGDLFLKINLGRGHAVSPDISLLDQIIAAAVPDSHLADAPAATLPDAKAALPGRTGIRLGLTGPDAVGDCGDVTLRTEAFGAVGIPAMNVYSWTAERVDEQPVSGALASIVSAADKGRLNLQASDLPGDGVVYKFTVAMQNFLGNESNVAAHRVLKTGEGSMFVLRGPSGWQEMTIGSELVFRVEFKVCGDASVDSTISWQANSSDVSLELVGVSQRISEEDIKGGQCYLIQASMSSYESSLTFCRTMTDPVARLRVQSQLSNLRDITINGGYSVDTGRTAYGMLYRYTCFVYDSDDMKTPCPDPNGDGTTALHSLAEWKGTDKQEVIIPAGQLPVGKYQFGLRVNVIVNGEKYSSSTEKDVTVVDTSTPIIRVTKGGTQPAQKIQVEAVVFHTGKLNISWGFPATPGFRFNMLRHCNQDFLTVLKPEGIAKKRVGLVCTDLPEQQTFKFRLTAEVLYDEDAAAAVTNERMISSHEIIEIMTASQPVITSVEVTPTQGTSLDTDFNIIVTGNHLHTCDYKYVIRDMKPEPLRLRQGLELQYVKLALSGRVAVRCVDSTGQSSASGSSDMITVTPVDPATLSASSVTVPEGLPSDVMAYLKTLATAGNGEASEEFNEEVLTQSQLAATSALSQSSDADLAEATIEATSLILRVLRQGKNDSTLSEETSQELTQTLTRIIQKAERTAAENQDADVTVARKRRALDDAQSEGPVVMEPVEIEAVFDNFATQFQSRGNEQQESLDFETTLLDELFPGLCLGSTVNDPRYVESQLGSMFNVLHQFDNINDLNDEEVFHLQNESASLSVCEDIKEHYENWTCGDGEVCQGLCLGVLLLHEDLLSLSRPDVEHDVPASGVLIIHAMNPDTGVAVEDYNPEAIIEFSLRLWEEVEGENETVECRTFTDGSWTSEGCETDSEGDDEEVVSCQCMQPGVFGLFKVPIPDDVTEKPEDETEEPTEATTEELETEEPTEDTEDSEKEEPSEDTEDSKTEAPSEDNEDGESATLTDETPGSDKEPSGPPGEDGGDTEGETEEPDDDDDDDKEGDGLTTPAEGNNRGDGNQEPTRASNPHNQQPYIPPDEPKKNISIKIIFDMDFNTEMGANGERLEPFKEAVRRWVSDRTDVPPHRITDINVERGSIIVTFTIEAATYNSSPDTSYLEVIELLTQAKDTNDPFTAPSGNTMVIMSFEHEVVTTPAPTNPPYILHVKKSMLPFIIIGALAGILILVIIAVVIMCMTKNLKGNHKVDPSPESQQTQQQPIQAAPPPNQQQLYGPGPAVMPPPPQPQPAARPASASRPPTAGSGGRPASAMSLPGATVTTGHGEDASADVPGVE